MDRLYIVDNGGGEAICQALADGPQIEVIAYGENQGIARPLNDVLARAAAAGVTHLITMDQDSVFLPGSMERYIAHARTFDWSSTLGLGPCCVPYDSETATTSISYERRYSVITSGNIISIENARAIGGFLEPLFIDEVDHEFCYRGYLRGLYTYVYTSGVYLEHLIGAPQEVRFLGRTFHPPMHNYIRTYYIFRNRLYILCHYHQLAPRYLVCEYVVASIRMAVSKLFFEADRYRKVRAMLTGVFDALVGTMGKKEFSY